MVITAWHDDVVEARFAPSGELAPRRTWSVVASESPWPQPRLTTNRGSDHVDIDCGRLRVRVRDHGRITVTDSTEGRVISDDGDTGGPHWREDGTSTWTRVMPPGEHYYGLGLRTGMLDKRGVRATTWVADSFEDHGPRTDAMSVPIPFVIGVDRAGRAWGTLLDNTFRSVVDLSDDIDRCAHITVDDGDLAFFLFAGPQPATIVDRLTALTGRAPIPPRWALGYQQTRWSYADTDEVRRVARELRARGLPADTIGLDIDALEDHRVFTWDTEHFGDPASLARELRGMGFHLTAVVDTGVSYEPEGGYAIYDDGAARGAFLRDPTTGGPALGYVWPGLCTFPDFADPATREWWGECHRALVEVGISGFVEDMNEPSIRDRPIDDPEARGVDLPPSTRHGPVDEPARHAEVHNVYGLLQARAAAEGARRLRPHERTLVLSRAGFTGIQRWAGTWTGDNASTWEHLELSLVQILELGVCGVSFVGADIGGFFGDCTPELLARWMQLGSCYPLARSNSARGTSPQEPWVHGDDVEATCRRALEWRSRLTPYLYTLVANAARSGTPVLRPLWFEFPDDPSCAHVADQALLGSAVLVAPVLRPGVRARAVSFPPGRWFDMWTDEVVAGPCTRIVDAPLATLPAFVRGGSILPTGPVRQWSTEAPLDPLVVDVYPDATGLARGTLYEDDGVSHRHESGEWCRTELRAHRDGSAASIVRGERDGAYRPAARVIEVRVHADGGVLTTSVQDRPSWEARVEHDH